MPVCRVPDNAAFTVSDTHKCVCVYIWWTVVEDIHNNLSTVVGSIKDSTKQTLLFKKNRCAL